MTTADARKGEGVALLREGRYPDAVRVLQRAAAAAPRDVMVLAALSQAQHRAGNSDAAVRTLRKAVRLVPDRADLHADLALVLTDLRALEPAVAAFRKAAERAPGDVEILADFARTLSETEALDEALQVARQACTLAPENVEALNSLGVVLYRRGEVEAARDAFARAAAAAPGHAHARKNLGMTELLCGDFEAGWRDYAARHGADGTRRVPGVPEWRGEGLYGQRLVVTAEQGLGDTIQFVRFLPRLTAMGAHVVFVAPPSLADLVKAMPGAGTVVAAGGRLPAADLQVALMDIPGLLKIRPDTIPADVPYLAAPGAMDLPNRRDGAFTVGLAWRGNPQHRGDRHRSIAPERLFALGAVRGVQLYSLQVGDPMPARTKGPVPVDLSKRLKSFGDTAAALQALDMVVSVDTAVAHLAGAMGRPVCLLLPVGPDWRWLCGSADSPWYPTMRLFRQPAAGDWQTPLDALTAHLGDCVARRAA